AKNLDQSGLKLQLIFICGKSTKLKEQLTAMKLKMPHFIEGFTKEVPYYMKLSDFFIGKPGPGSISEAIHLGLPVVVTRNALTLPQERYNADWVTENGLGMVLKHFGEIVPGVAEMLAPGKLSSFQANARKMDNRAVFEIPEIIDKLLR
ncbi:MAG: glycosyltransferase, partial [Acidobacteria bacterium]|nr:glycosyltransferase [Acidobacteriota bacterium]